MQAAPFLCQRLVLRAPGSRAMARLDIGNVVRAPRGNGIGRTRRRLRGGGGLNGGRQGRVRRGALLTALLGLAVQIIGSDYGGCGLWFAGAEQRVGGDALEHANHDPFRAAGAGACRCAFNIWISDAKRHKFNCAPLQLFSKMGL